MLNLGFGRFTFLGSERYPNVGFHRFTISGSDRLHCPMHSDRIPSPGIRSIPIGIGRILEIPTLDPIVSHRIWSDPIVGFNDLGTDWFSASDDHVVMFEQNNCILWGCP